MKLLINPLRRGLARVRLSTRHVLIHALEALNQHNSPKTRANPVVPVRVCHMPRIKHTYRYTNAYIADDPQRAILFIYYYKFDIGGSNLTSLQTLGSQKPY